MDDPIECEHAYKKMLFALQTIEMLVQSVKYALMWDRLAELGATEIRQTPPEPSDAALAKWNDAWAALITFVVPDAATVDSLTKLNEEIRRQLNIALKDKQNVMGIKQDLVFEHSKEMREYRDKVVSGVTDLIVTMNTIMDTQVTHAERRGQLIWFKARTEALRDTVRDTPYDIPF